MLNLGRIFPYQYTLQGTDTAELFRVAPEVGAKLKNLRGLVGVTSDLQIGTPQIIVDIDRNKSAALGVSAQQIETTLYDAYGSRQVSTIYAPNNQYWVIMELAPQYQADPSALSLLYVRSSSGSLVPLNAVATLRPSVGVVYLYLERARQWRVPDDGEPRRAVAES